MIEGGWAYVWPAYGVALLVLAGLSLSVWLHAQRWARAEKELVSREGDQS
jgi:heme exporter protein CcmD